VEAVIYLDTNVLLWLAGAPEQLSDTARAVIDEHEQLLFSPMVELEIEYLYEVGRIRQPSSEVIAHLRGVIHINSCNRSFASVVAKARELKWTRDPFDRIIAAQAALGPDPLLTRDRIIQANYSEAIW
jgi:PIN domain nuclease of toxin-antitoxin system